jgi:type IV secretion system protein VirB9
VTRRGLLPCVLAWQLGAFNGVAAAVPATTATATAPATASDPRLREVTYDPQAVVTVPVKRGVVTLVVLDADEAITEVAAGLGGDCSKADAAWCIAAQPGGRHLFVKPKSSATAPNNLAVVTDKRTHSFRFVVLAEADAKAPVFRLVVKAPAPKAAASRQAVNRSPALANVLPLMALAQSPQSPPSPTAPSPQDIVAERLQAHPRVVNSHYSVAEAEGSADIVPSLVFDDGRFTYFRFAGNGQLPAVFEVLGDQSETLVNTRMEAELLVVDRISRRLMLRAGTAVVGVWNEAFDLEGLPFVSGTTVPGVLRELRQWRVFGSDGNANKRPTLNGESDRE